jgi:hypothetical protein
LIFRKAKRHCIWPQVFFTFTSLFYSAGLFFIVLSANCHFAIVESILRHLCQSSGGTPTPLVRGYVNALTEVFFIFYSLGIE